MNARVTPVITTTTETSDGNFTPPQAPTPVTVTTTDTTGSDTVPPGTTSHLPLVEDATAQVQRLAAFLAGSFPTEVARTNRQVPETAVEVAIRLLLSLSTHADPSQVTRCEQDYCNQPAGHTTPHGIVHSG